MTMYPLIFLEGAETHRKFCISVSCPVGSIPEVVSKEYIQRMVDDAANDVTNEFFNGPLLYRDIEMFKTGNAIQMQSIEKCPDEKFTVEPFGYIDSEAA